MRHLDVETFAPAIPRFAGTSPYEQIPFLFSVHAERDGAPPEHADYLHEGDDNPRPLLADRLIAAAGREGTLCTYSGYERRVLRDLATALPERAPALRAIQKSSFRFSGGFFGHGACMETNTIVRRPPTSNGCTGRSGAVLRVAP